MHEITGVIIVIEYIIALIVIIVYIYTVKNVRSTRRIHGAKTKTTRYRKCNYYIDAHGYKRYKSNGKLVHRDIAYKKYSYDVYKKPFGKLVVHHIDGNKLNNSPNNLQILTQEEHRKIHGIIRYRGRDYIRLCPASWITKKYSDGYIINRKFIHKWATIIRGDDMYVWQGYRI